MIGMKNSTLKRKTYSDGGKGSGNTHDQFSARMAKEYAKGQAILEGNFDPTETSKFCYAL